MNNLLKLTTNAAQCFAEYCQDKTVKSILKEYNRAKAKGMDYLLIPTRSGVLPYTYADMIDYAGIWEPARVMRIRDLNVIIAPMATMLKLFNSFLENETRVWKLSPHAYVFTSLLEEFAEFIPGYETDGFVGRPFHSYDETYDFRISLIAYALLAEHLIRIVTECQVPVDEYYTAVLNEFASLLGVIQEVLYV